MHIESFWEESQALFGVVSDANKGLSWLLVAGKNRGILRRPLWRQLSAALKSGLPTCIIGDFNVIKEEEEKKGGAPFQRHETLCRVYWRERSGGSELQSTHLSPGATGSRTTKAFTSGWTDASSRKTGISVIHSLVEVLVRTSSDHHPLLLHFDFSLKVKALRFKFEDFWISYGMEKIQSRDLPVLQAHTLHAS